MLDSIIFDSNPSFGHSATFVYFSLQPPGICYAASVDFILLSGREGALFFMWEQMMYTSDRTFIKKIKPFACHYISMPW